MNLASFLIGTMLGLLAGAAFMASYVIPVSEIACAQINAHLGSEYYAAWDGQSCNVCNETSCSEIHP